jgi:tRNA threonylcarbamoyladenosine biosynthesis protein TsaB
MAAAVLCDATQSAVFACLDARMGELYWGCFERDSSLGVRATVAQSLAAPTAIRLEKNFAGVAVGRGLSAYPDLAIRLGLECSDAGRLALPRAADVARLGILQLAAGRGVDAAELAPCYLRDQVAQTERERRLLK